MGHAMSEQLLSLLLFVVAMTFSPGPNNVLIASSGVQVGMRRSIPLGLGVLAGTALMVVIAAIGLASIIHSVPSIQVVMKAIGSVYLIWLGWKVAHAGAPDLATAAPERPRGFMTGAINTWLNPKGWTMALSAAAGYTALAPNAPQLALTLATVFALVFIPSWALWCGGGRTLARLLRTDRHWNVANAVLGALVIISLIPMWLE
jgi:threonine/homoserine/homoserine lactone efflux protein